MFAFLSVLTATMIYGQSMNDPQVHPTYVCQ